MIFSAVFLPTPGARASVSTCWLAMAWRSASGESFDSNASAVRAPTPCTPSSSENSSALFLAGETVERQLILADDQVRMQIARPT
ncbi:MAG: hypothetical protein KatS3mg052_2204 [Candidatus Roseilinea sp.]|nr:MAG: hypothetical protein KatS3mg052_2204 [Candidatus Roseilinea sp.]